MSDPMQLEAVLDRTRIPAGAATPLQCHLKLRGSKALGTASGPARLETHLCLLFDCSASMQGRKLDTSIAAAKSIVDMLHPRQHLSLVGFQSRTRVLVDNVKATVGNKDGIKEQIDKIRAFAGGSTNLAAGINHAVKLTLAHPADARVMMILSDGRADSPSKAEQAALEATKAGVQLFALGIGGDYEADHLLKLVTPSNGAVFGDRDLNQVEATFARLIGRIASFFATNARLRIDVNLGVRLGPVYKTSPERAFLGVPAADAGRSVQLNAGNLEAGQTYAFLLELEAPARPEGLFELARVTLTCDLAAAGLAAMRSEARVVVHYARDTGSARDSAVGEAYRGARQAQLVHALAQAHRTNDRKQLLEHLAALIRLSDEAGDGQMKARCQHLLADVKAGRSLAADKLNAVVLASTGQAVETAPPPPTRGLAPRTPPARAPPPPPRTPARRAPPPRTPAPAARTPARQAPPPRPEREDEAGARLYDVVVLDPGDSVIGVVREIRDVTGRTLREITDVVRAAPAAVQLGVKRAEAAALKKRLEDAGARVDLRPHAAAGEEANDA